MHPRLQLQPWHQTELLRVRLLLQVLPLQVLPFQPRVERALNNEDREALFGESPAEAECATADGNVNTVLEFKLLKQAEKKLAKNRQANDRINSRLQEKGASRVPLPEQFACSTKLDVPKYGEKCPGEAG